MTFFPSNPCKTTVEPFDATTKFSAMSVRGLGKKDLLSLSESISELGNFVVGGICTRAVGEGEAVLSVTGLRTGVLGKDEDVVVRADEENAGLFRASEEGIGTGDTMGDTAGTKEVGPRVILFP